MATRRALISVSDKTGLLPFASALARLGFTMISTEGTAKLLTGSGLAVTPISALTGYPELLNGRVKTLHPAIAAAILADGDRHADELRRHGIAPIDLVVVNLYPFEKAAAGELRDEDLVEWIDIGGVTLLRAAAKNWRRVGVVCEPAQYDAVREELDREGRLSESTRRRLAARAFSRTAAYDAAIARRLAGDGDGAFPDHFVLTYIRQSTLRYGENPHQRAALYGESGMGPSGVTGAPLLQGKPLSYNNLVDLDAAWNAVREFDRPAAVVIKHATPCGAAVDQTVAAAVARALAADETSAFGGIVAVNRPFDGEAAEALGSLFLEAVIAPEIEPAAQTLLAARRSLRVLAGGRVADASGPVLRSVSGGLLLQEHDARGAPERVSIVTPRAPGEAEWRDLRFAWLVCKHVRSNAIVLAKDEQTVGIGGGQTSRVDSVHIAARKAGVRARGSVLASDAFFPFPDGVAVAAAAGVTAIVQTGGSVRDAEVIAAAEEAGLAMVFTGERHFRH